MFNVPFIIFVKGTAVMPPYVILSVSEVSTRFFTTFRMTVKCAKLHHVTQNDKQGRNRSDLNATARIKRAFGLSAFS